MTHKPSLKTFNLKIIFHQKPETRNLKPET